MSVSVEECCNSVEDGGLGGLYYSLFGVCERCPGIQPECIIIHLTGIVNPLWNAMRAIGLSLSLMRSAHHVQHCSTYVQCLAEASHEFF